MAWLIWLKELIKALLRRLHLFTPAYRLYARLRGWSHGSPAARTERFYASFDTFVEAAQRLQSLYQQPTVVFYGQMNGRKKLLCRIARRLAEQRPQGRVLFFLDPSLNVRVNRDLRAELDRMLTADSITLPENYYYSYSLDLALTAEQRALIDATPCLQRAIANARDALKKAAPNYIEVLLCEYYRCYQALLDNVNIAVMVIWNAFRYHHLLLDEMCRERGIPVAYGEFGSLPGTYVFDAEGQMGQSWPATHPQAFLDLPVTPEDCARAGRTVELLRKSGLNRNQQPEKAEGSALSRLKPGRPIVLFAGQCDRDSGMLPYTETSRRYHSPSFTTSLEAMLFLAELAKKHDWNYIFKPHPLVKDDIEPERLPDNVLFVKDVNINEIIDMSDLVVTILSTTVYVSLIRQKPALMLGYNQISGKGCAYEALTREQIEPTMLTALREGYTPAQRAAFLRHVAQMDRHYLYSDGEPRGELACGRPLSAAAGFFAGYLDRAAAPAAGDGTARFVCASPGQVLCAVQLRAALPAQRPCALLLLDGPGHALSRCVDTGALGACFATVQALTLPARGEDALAWREACGQALASLPACRDLYLPGLDDACLAMAWAAQRRDGALRLHLYSEDELPIASPQDARDLMRQSAVLADQTEEEGMPLFEALCELRAPDTAGYARDARHRMAVAPLPGVWCKGAPDPGGLFAPAARAALAPELGRGAPRLRRLLALCKLIAPEGAQVEKREAGL